MNVERKKDFLIHAAYYAVILIIFLLFLRYLFPPLSPFIFGILVAWGLQRPAKELKGFDKVFLKPGECKTLSIRLGDKSFRFYDPYLHKFVLEDGEFTISVGASSADIRLTASVNMKF